MVHGSEVPWPIACSICPTAAETLKFAQSLERAGCALLAVHCRSKPADQQEFHDAPPDYRQLRQIVAGVGIPVVMNGQCASCSYAGDLDLVRITRGAHLS
jgi:tRNA-dihydrouridine synthase